MENGTALTYENQCWALLDQLAAKIAGFFFSGSSCPIPFSSLIDSSCRNRIDRWIDTRNSDQLQTVFSGFLQQLNDENNPEETPLYNDMRLQKITEYVHRHYSGKIRVRKAAQDIGMAEASFCRFFKKTYGEHFTDYVNKIRIEYAVRRLLETKDSVSEIGYACGFNSIDYFIRIFKKIKGCTPGEYRKNKSNNSG